MGGWVELFSRFADEIAGGVTWSLSWVVVDGSEDRTRCPVIDV